MTRERDKILLALTADCDPRSLAGGLVEMGYDVFIASDGARALELTVQESPSIVVIDLKIPVIDGPRVFRITRNNPNTSKTPFVFVSQSSVDISGFRPGLDSLILKPFKAEELYARIRDTLLVISGRQSISGQKELEGRLDGISLADVIQMIYMNRREGELVVRRGGESGVIYFRGGHICDAELDGMGRTKALFRLLSWKGARFEFYSRPVDMSRRINAATGNLLIEGMRQIDELERIRSGRDDTKVFPSENSVVRVREGLSIDGPDIGRDERDVLALVEMYERVRDIIDGSQRTDYETYKTLSSLIEKGLVEVVDRGCEGAEPEELLNAGEAMRLREAVTRIFPDLGETNQIRVLFVSRRGETVAAFLRACGNIRDFDAGGLRRFAKGPPLGEAAEARFPNGMEALFYALPASKGMAPLWSAFSTKLAGLILLWDEEDEYGEAITLLKEARDHILSLRPVGITHVVLSKEASPEEALERYRKEMNPSEDEPLTTISKTDCTGAKEALRSLFMGLLKTTRERAAV